MRGPFALVDDVLLFPLGLSAVPSTAAKRAARARAVAWFPSLSRVLPVSIGFVLSLLLARHLRRRPPRTVSEVCTVAGVVMAALILLAPNPRVGYLLYPVNFLVWAYLMAGADSETAGSAPDVITAVAPGTA